MAALVADWCIVGDPHLPVLQGLKARNFIHSKIEQNLRKKVQESGGGERRDALQQLIDSSRRSGEPLSIKVTDPRPGADLGSARPGSDLPFCLQAIQESATELLFGGHETTASTATSLIMMLGLNPGAASRLRQELKDQVLIRDCRTGPAGEVLVVSG